MMFRGGRVLVLLCFMTASRAATAQPPALPDVLQRAGAYVVSFQYQLAGIVAEERYVQDAFVPPQKPLLFSRTEHRELRSDLLLIKPPTVKDWIQFRDVFEVDGLPIRDRDERLLKLLLDPSATGNARIERILDEGAQYNVGTILRNINVPVVPLLYLNPGNQKRFKFKRASDRRPAMATPASAPMAADGVFRVNEEVWAIEYEEKDRPTFIRTTARKSLPSKGRFWIEPDTGRVLMSELILKDRDVNAIIDVSYQSEPLLGFLVPIEMRERYEGRFDKSHIEGVATYGRFRQFQVNTNETFLIKR
jgi:hypothetical protein